MILQRWLTTMDLIDGATRLVPGHGPTNAKIMLVGEAPGEDEDKQGLPFIGRCGQVLNEHLDKAGIDRTETFITNVVKARPTKKVNDELRNRAPTETEVNQYKEWLWDEVQLVRPKVIVCLGKVPTKLLFKIQKTFTMRRYLLSAWDSKELWGPNSFQCWLRAAWHPSYLMQHGRQYIDDQIEYLKEAKKLSEQ